MFIGPSSYGQVGRSASAYLAPPSPYFLLAETKSGCSWSQYGGGGSAWELFSDSFTVTDGSELPR